VKSIINKKQKFTSHHDSSSAELEKM